MSTRDKLLKDTEHIKQLTKNLGKLLGTHHETLKATLDSAPAHMKPQIEDLQKLSQKVIDLAKDGKSTEANELLKNYTNVTKDSQ